MNIMFSERAKEQLTQEKVEGKLLKLVYDTDGCGCVVNGVAHLTVNDQVAENEIEITTNFIPVWIDRSKLVFFEEEMTIDFLPQYFTFQLKSPNQMINPRMRLVLG